MKLKKIVFVFAVILFVSEHARAIQKNKNTNDKDTLKVMSFNIRHCTNKDGKLNMQRTAEAITHAGPNIVLLQEVDNKTGRSEGKDQAAELGKLTGMEHVFGKAINFNGGEYGVAVLSKFPIVKSKNILLPYKQGTEQRTALWVALKVGKDTLTVVTTHLESGREAIDFETRLLQVKDIKEQILAHPHPVILGGDLNSHPDFPGFLFLKSFMKPSDKEPYTPTYPGIDPWVKIDYILMYKPERFTVLDYEVVDNELVSDHRPIISTLLLKEVK
ncbi:endonuclease/exonuclease/phosphatase family protein [Tamlana sp. 2201CG12-4]|uniref:endonuclease/exonuclease/phosphatase family protein n=1 Tax=Tamlana sp. 2201CG12-4 TaxID=3112582 RepID=UPI002DB58B64|nr:endonuclease/exonuclease/phosphatase family protein [Tamlana sp. 2201CG12-4]MEC3908236.1 endonuclease/exonuclease/phosphatase family protein [Tamlana sp. 2201CG12-4]